jgi:hypothetical protein
MLQQGLLRQMATRRARWVETCRDAQLEFEWVDVWLRPVGWDLCTALRLLICLLLRPMC